MDPAEVVSEIRQLVNQSGRIPGSRLGGDLKENLPDWDPAAFGVRNLREFITKNVPEVIVVDHSGMDVVYGTREAKNSISSASTQSMTGDDAWRAWVSPKSPFDLAFDESSGHQRLVGRGDPTPVGHVRIDPTTSAEHRAIAREYLDSASETDQEVLRSILGSEDERWWQPWLAEMRNRGELGAWNSFRNSRLRELLKRRLEKTDLDAAARETALVAVIESRRPRRQSHPTTEPQAVNTIRRIVVATVEQMLEEDLRELKLPLGLVLDVIDDLKR